LREAHNQKLAQKVNEEAQFYCTKKEECKKEMEKVSEHIHSVIKTLYTYDVFYDELNAKLRRILHLEGKIPFDEYHSKSKEEMKNAAILIDSLKELISVPMAGENGSLSREGVEALERSNHILDLYREKLYQ
jgi:HSP90 family molecular chaperone